jgi:hypothetical protein
MAIRFLLPPGWWSRSRPTGHTEGAVIFLMICDPSVEAEVRGLSRKLSWAAQSGRGSAKR